VIATAGFQAVDWILIAAIAVLLGMSGALALAETSLIGTTRAKAKALLDDHRHGARQLARLVEDPQQFLNPILLLVLVCQLVSATLVGVLASHWFGPLGVVVATVFEVVVIFVLFEAAPKNWAVQNPERAALFSAPIVMAIIRFPPIRAISFVLIGLADLLIGRRGKQTGRPRNVTESELLAMADVAREDDVIEPEERAYIHSVIEFGDTVVREVMVPRPDMVTLEANATVTAGLAAALDAGHSRLPVHDHNVDDVLGIAYAKDLMRAERGGHGSEPVREHVRPATFVPETKRLSGLLRDMQGKRVHLSIVVDEYGGTAGLVTLEDLIEELVGEIVDEFDPERPLVHHHPDGSVEVDGLTPLDDADELLGVNLPRGSWDTVGGLVLDQAGRIPEQGESVDVDGLRFEVIRVEGRRIQRVRIGVGSKPTRDHRGDGADHPDAADQTGDGRANSSAVGSGRGLRAEGTGPADETDRAAAGGATRGVGLSVDDRGSIDAVPEQTRPEPGSTVGEGATDKADRS
jgi:CBS domain containing-hemolysin-like protein